MKRLMVAMVLVAWCSNWATAASSVWKAQKGSSIMYLGGTCHVLRQADYPLPAEFHQAYRSSDIIVFETDIGKLADPSTQQKLMAHAMYADGGTIDTHLSPVVYGQLSAYCLSHDIPLQAFSTFKPSLLMVTLTVIQLKNLGVSAQGVDQYFHGLARGDKKIIAGLETIDQQISYLTTMADGNEDDFVRHSLKDMQTLERLFGALADAWRAGDATKLDQLMVRDLKTRQPQLYQRLITDRNRNWLPLIESYQKTPQTEFILVGVAHLVGPDGLIQLLKNKGYGVKQL